MLTISQNLLFKKYPLWFECVSGLLFGGLNFILSIFFRNMDSTFFMDTIFTVTASFVGWWSGILSVLSFALISVLTSTVEARLVNFLFGITVLSMVFIIRLVYHKKERVSMISLLYVYVLSVFFISFFGAIVAIFAFSRFEYLDLNNLRYITLLFSKQHISPLLSAFLARLPVNGIDKLIAVMVGFGVYKLVEKTGLKTGLISE